jgi:hypothetical protein
MPKLGGGGCCDESICGGWLMVGNGVERTRTTAALDHVPSAKILNRKTKGVKFDRDMIINCKLTNRQKVFNYIWNYKKITKNERVVGKRKGSMTGGGNRQRDTISDSDMRGRGRRCVEGKHTGIRGHVRGGARVHDPFTRSG